MDMAAVRRPAIPNSRIERYLLPLLGGKLDYGDITDNALNLNYLRLISLYSK